MANLEVQPGWPAARQLGRDEFASGGPDGNLNEHAKVFLARTELLKNRVNSILDFEGNNDTDKLGQALNNTNRLFINTKQSIIDQIPLNKDNIELIGDNETVLSQPNINKHTLFVGWFKGDPNNNITKLIKNIKIHGLKFGSMPIASADDFAAINVGSGENTQITQCVFEDTENSVKFTANDQAYGVPGAGAKDNLAAFNLFIKSKRFVVQNLQASYSRIIGNIAHNYGDNSYTPDQSTVNNGGQNSGIRLAGLSKGNLVALNIIRDKWTAFSFQRGNKHNIVQSNYIENTYHDGFNASTSKVGAAGKHIISDMMIVDSGGVGAKLNYLGLTRFSGSIFKTGLNSVLSKYGIDTYPAITNDTQYIISFNSASGIVPTADTVLTQGVVTFKVVQVRNEALTIINAGDSMPVKGTLIVKSIVGGILSTSNIAELPLSIVSIDRSEGANRIDAIVSDAGSSSARIGTNANLVTLISNFCPEADLNLSGNNNLVTATVSDRKENQYSTISGNNNILILTDDDILDLNVGLLVSGNNNIIIFNSKARLSVSGNNNTMICNNSRVSILNGAIGNKLSGRILIINDLGTNTDLSDVYRAKNISTWTGTTNSVGNLVISHGLISAPKSLIVNLINNPDYYCDINSLAHGASQSLITVKKRTDNSLVINTQITVSFIASI